MRVIRDGKVAVFVSAGYGAGWSTWASDEDDFMLYGDERMVSLVEDEKYEEAKEYARSVVGDDVYLGGIDGLYVQWVDEGTRFVIDEYDGAETLMEETGNFWSVA